MSDMLPETYGQGYEAPNVEVTDNEQISTTAVSQEDNSNAGNPAWDEALSAIPQEFHGHLKDHFGKWDKGVQARFEKVQQESAPLKAYKEFAERNVPTTDIDQALKIYSAINTQPKAVYEYLREQFNFGTENSQGQQEAEPSDYDLSEEVDLTKNPQFKAMSEKAERAEQFVQQMEQRERQAAADKAVAVEAKAVEDKFPNLDLADVATFAMGNARQSGGVPNLMAAAEYLNNLVTPKARVSDTAPPIVSGGNRGIPQPPAKAFGDMTPDERGEYIATRMAALNAG